MNKNEGTRTFDTAARMLKAVAHPVRIKIIDHLSREKRLSVNELKEKLNITQSMTSQHLAQLRNTGILGSIKEANVCYYYIFNKNVLKLLECIQRCSKNNNM
ncbi:MAG: helix-turn-helix transcriptional regulator [Candidatus Omnitrophica bacterium]|nr:helix-turn-helix transcriptional regulator [Candidatus Omnitrophota bacterium]MCK5178125.1 helix-turn-helix transcriptional regulator [Candidatus Omnitrophota bacterium]MCK5259429.1 helix-turn-helix transcriptional regulator [Candidatus Omnitrophota bacterium]